MGTEPGSRKKRLLAPQEQFEIWMQLVRGETTIGDAAERNRVDRPTIAKLKVVAQRGALEALAASRPGRRQPARDHELEDTRAEVDPPWMRSPTTDSSPTSALRRR